MSASELAWRSVHDLGLAGWFGGSLLNTPVPGTAEQNGRRPGPDDDHDSSGESSDSTKKKRKDPEPGTSQLGEESRAASVWAPVMLGSMALHLVGGAGLLAWNASRLAGQRGVVTSTVAKSAATAAAIGLTLMAWRDQAKAEDLHRSRAADDDRRRRSLERRRAVTGWLLPLTTGSIVVLGALEGEQQRPREMARGILANLPGVSG